MYFILYYYLLVTIIRVNIFFIVTPYYLSFDYCTYYMIDKCIILFFNQHDFVFKLHYSIDFHVIY